MEFSGKIAQFYEKSYDHSLIARSISLAGYLLHKG